MSVEPVDQPTALYRIYDSAGALLYVGISLNPLARWSAHVQRDWWYRVTRIDVAWFDTRREAEAAEREAIKQFDPPYNVVHTRRNGQTPSSRPLVVTSEGRLAAADSRTVELERLVDAGEWLTIGRVVELLQISRSKVQYLLTSGTIGSRRKASSKYRFCDPTDVRRLLDESRVIYGGSHAARPSTTGSPTTEQG